MFRVRDIVWKRGMRGSYEDIGFGVNIKRKYGSFGSNYIRDI